MPERRIINGWIVQKNDDGTLTTIGPAGGQMPQNPTYQYQGPQAAANLTRTQADIANDAVRIGIAQQAEARAREAEDRARTAQLADLAAKGMELGPDGQPRFKPLPDDQLAKVKSEAQDKINILNDLERGSNDWFATGFMAPAMANYGGTNAANMRANAGTVKASGALANLMEMAKANGGKNPLTPVSNSDIEMMGNVTANLDISQSDDQYRKNVGRYRDFYQRQYDAADKQQGDRTLPRVQQAQYDKYVRENPNATPAQRQRFMEVLKTQSERLYNQEWARIQKSRRQTLQGAPRRAAPIDNEVAGYLSKYGAR